MVSARTPIRLEGTVRKMRRTPHYLERRRTGGPMRSRTTLLLGSFASLGMANVALGQTESRPRTSTMVAAPAKPTGKPAVRTGTMPPPPPPAPQLVATSTGFQQINAVGFVSPTPIIAAPVFGAQPAIAQITYFPTLVLTDGRVFANFGTGRGYEQVLRQCAQFTGGVPYGVNVSPCWTVDANGRYAVIQQR